MKIEASAQEIRALLELAAADLDADSQASEARPASRDALARRLPPRMLERYERLLERGRAPVVVAIEGGTCSGCHMRLPTMVEYGARSSPAVHTCPHCRRMLYSPELLGEGPRAEKHAEPRRGSRATAGRSS